MVSLVLPRSNPDFDSVYQHVENWWFELDESNVVCREIAFDPSGAPVVNRTGYCGGSNSREWSHEEVPEVFT
jgi:hypothetical protein